MRNFIFSVILILLVIGCNNKRIKEQCLNDKYFANAIGSGSPNGTDTLFKILDKLSKSDLRGAFIDFDHSGSNELKVFNGYRYLVPIGNNNMAIRLYCAYRIAEYIDDVDKNTLMLLLNQSYLLSNQNNICEQKIYKIEYDYLSCYNTQNDQKRKNTIDSFSIYQNNLNYRRANYLYANLLYDFVSKTTALAIYKKLLFDDFYQMPILKKMMWYYAENKMYDSVRVFSKIYAAKYPSQCNAFEILENVNNSEPRMLNKCDGNYSQKDSITARVFFTRSRLTNSSLQDIEDLYKSYKEANKEFILDSLKIWERGEYYDIYLRYLFKTRQYDHLLDFIIKEVGYNKKIVVENEKDLLQLITEYYIDYNGNSANSKIKQFFADSIIQNKKLRFNLKNLQG